MATYKPVGPKVTVSGQRYQKVKKPVWPWVVGVIVLLALIGGGNKDKAETPAIPVQSTAQ